MATQENTEDGDITSERSKSKIVILLAVGIITIGLVVAGILYGLGFFDQSLDAESAIAAMDSKERADLQQEASNARAGTQASYYEITPNLISNISNSRQMIQLKVAVMTVYDEEEQIIERVKLHDYPIRSAFLQVLSEQTEEMMLQPEFRESLALRLKNTINEVLTEIEGSGGVEAVYFTEFLIQ